MFRLKNLALEGMILQRPFIVVFTYFVLCFSSSYAQVNASVDTAYAHPYFNHDIVITSTLYNTSEDTIFINRKMLEDITCLTDTDSMRTYNTDLKASYIILKDFPGLQEIFSPELPDLPSDDTLLDARDFEKSILINNDLLPTVRHNQERFFMIAPYSNITVSSIVSLDLSFYKLTVPLTVEQKRRASVDIVLHSKYYSNADPIIRDLFSIPPSSELLKSVFLQKILSK
jgi:hypothetical protein